MTNNPLFPANDDDQNSSLLFLSPHKSVQPSPSGNHPDPHSANPAADMIRHKLEAIYANEPTVKQELSEVKVAERPLSKHQLFIQKLSTSGKSLAEIQTEWHNYYVGLHDNEKHEVWQEFYEANAHSSRYAKYVSKQQPKRLTSPTRREEVNTNPSRIVVAEHYVPTQWDTSADKRTVADVRKQIMRRVTAGGKLRPKHHLQSLLFGLGLGVFVLLIFLFGFFNEIVIAPFIQPSRHASSTPLIVSADSVIATGTQEVIIPKINVEIPVDYSQTSSNESTIENALQNGVVHYPSTVMPGQRGNTAFFGHSSNNIFNPGKYKFAFVLLHQLVPGDTFYLTYNHKAYVYEVIARKIVSPNDVGVLNDTIGKVATATLITCDPPGTSINRLVVTGEQISPDPSGNSAAPAPVQSTAQPATLPADGPTLWSRLWHWLF